VSAVLEDCYLGAGKCLAFTVGKRDRKVSASRFCYDLRRQKLDPMLRELAAETPGVELMLGQDVTGLVRSDGRSSGVRAVDRRRHERNVTARVIVAS
jgi:flavin-dependent dehydrogenase